MEEKEINAIQKKLERFSSADKLIEPKNFLNADDAYKISSFNPKRLQTNLDNKELIRQNSARKIKKFSQKNKSLFREFLKRTLIERGDKGSLNILLMECLKKEPSLRRKDENNIIKNFLLNSQLIKALLNIQFFNKKHCENFINSITSEVRFKTVKREEILCKIGTKADNFYIIFKGTVSIEGLEPYSVSLTCRQYIKAITDKYQKIYHYKDKYALKEKGTLINYQKILFENYKNYDNDEHDDLYSKYVFEKTLEINKHIVNIENNEICLLNLISLIIDIKNLFCSIKSNYNLLLLLIEEYNYDHKKTLKGMNYLSINFFVHSVAFNMKQIYKNIPEINEELIEKYEKLMENSKCYNFSYLRKGKLAKLQNMGDCFGDITPEMNFNLNNDNKRNYNANVVDETNFAYIPFDKFSELLKLEKEEIKNTESKFLKNNFFFGDINQYSFIQKYLKHFTYEELLYNNYLFTEGQKGNYVYFLKFGKYEIFCEKSINKICSLINEISNNYYEKSKKRIYSNNK